MSTKKTPEKSNKKIHQKYVRDTHVNPSPTYKKPTTPKVPHPSKKS